MTNTEQDAESHEDLFAKIRLEVSETAKAWLYCFDCGTVVTVSHDDDIIGGALLGRGVPCTKCQVPIDPWHVLVESFKQSNPGSSVPIGLKHTAIFYRLPTRGIKTPRLNDEGITPNAQILHVRHEINPFEHAHIVDLDAVDSARQPGVDYRLACLWSGETQAPPDVQGTIMVLWAEHDSDDIARQQLVAAIQALGNGRPNESIVPASVAVEEPLKRAIGAYYEWVGVKREERKQLLRSPFNVQLNALAPAMAKQLGLPPLAPHVLEALNDLRRRRNDTAHTGTGILRPDVVARCLAGAVYGFRHARMLEELTVVLRGQSASEAHE